MSSISLDGYIYLYPKTWLQRWHGVGFFLGAAVNKVCQDSARYFPKLKEAGDGARGKVASAVLGKEPITDAFSDYNMS